MPLMATPTTLLDLLRPVPAEQTAIILPEQNIRITYGGLRNQVEAVADSLAAAGITRGDRVGMALPNGLPTIVGFLAASVAGTAAPLNPAYKEDEFRFYLEDTNARVLLLPPDGAEGARRAAGDRVPVLTVGMDAAGVVSLSGAPRGAPIDVAGCGRCRVDPAHERQHRPAETRAAFARQPLHLGGKRRAQLRAHLERRVAVRDAAVPRPRSRGVDARHAGNRRHRGRAGQVQSAVVLARRPRLRGDVVFGGADAAPAAPGARRTRRATPAGAEKLRFIRSCSASLPPQVMHDLEAAFGAPVLEAYGMTEAAHQMASNPLPPGARKPGSVGPGTDVRVSIMDARRQAPANRRARRGRHPGPERHHADTKATPRRTRRRSSTDGSAPAIRASWTPMAI